MCRCSSNDGERKSRSQKWKATWCKTFEHSIHLSTTIFHCWLVLFTYETHFTLHTACFAHTEKPNEKKNTFFPTIFSLRIYLLRLLLLLLWMARSELHDQTKRNFIATGFSFFFSHISFHRTRNMVQHCADICIGRQTSGHGCDSYT